MNKWLLRVIIPCLVIVTTLISIAAIKVIQLADSIVLPDLSGVNDIISGANSIKDRVNAVLDKFSNIDYLVWNINNIVRRCDDDNCIDRLFEYLDNRTTGEIAAPYRLWDVIHK